jgi:hypothetical protein
MTQDNELQFPSSHDIEVGKAARATVKTWQVTQRKYSISSSNLTMGINMRPGRVLRVIFPDERTCQ